MNNIQKISLCIPKMDVNTNKKNILQTFGKLNIGYVDYIREIPIHNDSNNKRIILNINLNMENELAKYIYETIMCDKTIKIVYNDPWYWICTKFINNVNKNSTST
jgi:hypothetical protein